MLRVQVTSPASFVFIYVFAVRHTWTTDLKNYYTSVFAWTSSSSSDRNSPLCGLTIHYHHHKASKQPTSSAAGCTYTIPLNSSITTHTHTIAVIAPLLVSHSHFLQPGAKSRLHLWKWPLKAWGCYKQDPPVPLDGVAGGGRQALCSQHGEHSQLVYFIRV